MKERQSLGDDKINQLAFHVAHLIAGFVQKNLTQSEEQRLDDWINASPENQRLFEELTDPENLEHWIKWKNKLPAAEALSKLENKLEFSDTPKKKSLVRSIVPYVAAASIIILIAVLWEWLPQKNKSIKLNKSEESIASDIAPGGNRATLTLSDGRKLLLDSAAQGQLVKEGEVEVNKNDSASITYQSTHTNANTSADNYNIITTPAGGTFRILLSDGTTVFLNANSSLRFPVNFSAEKRTVELIGEGYFEVAKNPARPFQVLAAGNTVTVLGTHFNINAYADEPNVKVALEEGSVRLNKDNILKPGELGVVSSTVGTRVMQGDMEKELAWKNGLFIFKQTQLDEIMRQVARWYNCEVKMEGTIADHFNASVKRDVPVSNLLAYLEGTGRVHFKIVDRTITVMP